MFNDKSTIQDVIDIVDSKYNVKQKEYIDMIFRKIQGFFKIIRNSRADAIEELKEMKSWMKEADKIYADYIEEDPIMGKRAKTMFVDKVRECIDPETKTYKIKTLLSQEIKRLKFNPLKKSEKRYRPKLMDRGNMIEFHNLVRCNVSLVIAKYGLIHDVQLMMIIIRMATFFDLSYVENYQDSYRKYRFESYIADYLQQIYEETKKEKLNTFIERYRNMNGTIQEYETINKKNFPKVKMKKPTKEELIALFTDDCRGTNDKKRKIAKHYGVCELTALNWMKKHGLTASTQKKEETASKTTETAVEEINYEEVVSRPQEEKQALTTCVNNDNRELIDMLTARANDAEKLNVEYINTINKLKNKITEIVDQYNTLFVLYDNQKKQLENTQTQSSSIDVNLQAQIEAYAYSEEEIERRVVQEIDARIAECENALKDEKTKVYKANDIEFLHGMLLNYQAKAKINDRDHADAQKYREGMRREYAKEMHKNGQFTLDVEKRRLYPHERMTAWKCKTNHLNSMTMGEPTDNKFANELPTPKEHNYYGI